MAQNLQPLLYPEWQASYLAAMLENDRTKLVEKLKEAEAAIFDRLQDLSDNTKNGDERTALDDAIRSLRLLKRESLKFPDWT